MDLNVFVRYWTKILEWKNQVENDIKVELELQEKVSCLTESLADNQTDKALDIHQKTMHPSYKIAGDNVGKRIVPRNFTSTKQTKAVEMVQLAAYKNRVSGNHLPSLGSKGDLEFEPFQTFLPS